jgi:hypothetical protein
MDRGAGGALADELIEQILSASRGHSEVSDAPQCIVFGNVHTQNHPCEALLRRHSFEPIDVPRNDYQRWARLIARS